MGNETATISVERHECRNSRIDGVDDESALIENDADLHRREALLNIGDFLVDVVGRADHVGVGLSRDR
jgi:hypothetical protein